MFRPNRNIRTSDSAFNILLLIFHGTVRNLRMSHSSAIIGLMLGVLRSMVFMAVFYVMFTVLGLRGAAVRGDFMLYLMSGVFLFLTHIRAIGAVSGAEGAASGMMQHSPMNTVIAISSSALAALYNQVFSVCVMLTLYYCLVTPFVIDQPVPAIAMFLLAWFSGCAIGLLFYSIKPWFPTFAGIASTVFQRANMIASGKMFLANTLPPSRLALFSWNPLFHTIDQARGFTFINYNPHVTSIVYPFLVSIALIMIGLMGEFYTRRHVSLSWSAR